MPDNNDAGEKTEQPTPRKLENARKEGQVPISTEVNTAGLLLIGFAALIILGPALYDGMASSMRNCMGQALTWELSDSTTLALLWDQHSGIISITMAMLGVGFLAALVLGLAQAGIFFTLKPLEPKFNRISPLSGLKRIFGLRGLMRLLFSICKLILIVSIAWWVIEGDIASQIYYSTDLRERTSDTAWLLILLAIKLAAVLGLVAVGDFLYQRFQHQKDLMMSKQEIKDEVKQSEGDPLIKSKIRQIQRQMAQNRMMQEVPTADVVITNPTHVAVALRYDPDKMDAPLVVAKGYDLIAQRIKAIATEHDIIQVENVPLARGLAKQVEVGHSIPVEFFQQVAEILSYVYRLKKKAV